MATDWTRTRRAAVEFMVITVGVFAALLADEWRQSLRDRAEESQYVERLLVEIEANIEAMDGMTRRITNRSPALMRLATVRDLDDPAVRAQVARDLDESAGWSWGTFPGSRAVFDELVSTGRLSLIRDPEVRGLVSDYYTWLEAQQQGISRRRAAVGIGPVSIRSVTMLNFDQGSGPAASQEDLDPDHRLIQGLDPYELRAAAVAELNVRDAIQVFIADSNGRARRLVELLEPIR